MYGIRQVEKTSMSKNNSIPLAILVELRLVIDGHSDTDRHRQGHGIERASIASRGINVCNNFKTSKVTFLLRRREAEYCVERRILGLLYVFLFVSLSVHEHISKTRPTCPILTIFCACYVWSWLGFLCYVAIRYVLPVLWMTSYFYIMTKNSKKRILKVTQERAVRI